MKMGSFVSVGILLLIVRAVRRVYLLLVAPERLELSHPCGYWILSPTRLPVPPQGLKDSRQTCLGHELKEVNFRL